MKFFTLFTLAAALFAIEVAAEGCEDCAGMTGGNRDELFNQCVGKCEGALKGVDDGVAGKCRENCEEIVHKNGCCYNGCSQRIGRRAHYEIFEPITKVEVRAVESEPEPEFAVGEVVNIEPQPTSSVFASELEKRDGPACCAGCDVLGVLSRVCGRSTSGGMAFSLGRMACAAGCLKAYGIACRLT